MICARTGVMLALMAAVAVVVPARQTSAHPPVARPTPSVLAQPAHPMRSVFFSAGLSLLPGGHVTVGAFVTPRFVIDFVAQTSFFGFEDESLVGMGAEVHLFGHGEQPRHAVTIGGHLMLNADVPLGQWNNPEMFGSSVGWAGDVLVGWRVIAANGFLFRLQAGFIVRVGEVVRDPEPIVARSSIGWAF